MWSGNLKGAISSLHRAKWRSLLIMLGIVIGISSVVTIVSLGEGLKGRIAGQINQLASDVVTVRPGKLVNEDAGGGLRSFNYLALFNASTLTEEDTAALQQLDNVESVVPITFVTSSVKTDEKALDNVFVGGTRPELADMLQQSIEYGAFFSTDDPADRFAVVGANIAVELFGTFNPVGQTLTISGQEFIVRGVLAESSGGLLSLAETNFNSSIFIPFGAAVSLTEKRSNILQILLKASDPDKLDATVADVKNTLLSTHDGQENFTVLKQAELINIATGVLNTITGFVSGLAAISLLVAGIGIMAIMLVSVSERTREIGVRKAVGATNRQILNQFLVEGVVLSIGGGVIGLIVSVIINFLLHLYTDLDPVLSPPVVVMAISVSVILGVLFSVAPALKAARKDPIEALRGD